MALQSATFEHEPGPLVGGLPYGHAECDPVLFVVSSDDQSAQGLARSAADLQDSIFPWSCGVSTEEQLFYALFIAERECVAAGTINTDNDPGVITNVLTHPSFRRLGMATAIMNALEGVALDRGLRRTRLTTLEAAPIFYKKLGYRHERPGSIKMSKDLRR